jgi:hypothetical protein
MGTLLFLQAISAIIIGLIELSEVPAND